MFKNAINEIFSESIECIVGNPIIIPKHVILVEDRPKTTHDIDSSAIVQAGFSRSKKVSNDEQYLQQFLYFHADVQAL
jgi:hypothetical protein